MVGQIHLLLKKTSCNRVCHPCVTVSSPLYVTVSLCVIVSLLCVAVSLLCATISLLCVTVSLLYHNYIAYLDYESGQYTPKLLRPSDVPEEVRNHSYSIKDDQHGH